MRKHHHKRTAIYCIALLSAALSSQAVGAGANWGGETLDGAPCEPPDARVGGSYGPWDYTDARIRTVQGGAGDSPLRLVEGAHFCKEVQLLVSGCKGRAYAVNELIYTLRAIPNHHRALMTAIEYSLLAPQKQRVPLRPPPECWLNRAVAFSPRDANARMIYGIYLHRKGRLDEAKRMYESAIELAPRLAEAHYNLGIVLADQSDFEAAREQARAAYDLGHPLPGLRRRLEEAGYPL